MQEERAQKVSLNVGRSRETQNGAVVVRNKTHETKECRSTAGKNDSAKKAEDR